MENQDTGLLLNKSDIELHRTWFNEMVKLLGVNVLYRSLMDPTKSYDLYGELDAYYHKPEIVGCIFEEHVNQWTMKKLGWDHLLAEANMVIHVPYNLKGLQAGCLFIIPSGIDRSEGRVFKVIRMSTKPVYPASIACEIGPVFESTAQKSEIEDFHQTDFNLLNEEED